MYIIIYILLILDDNEIGLEGAKALAEAFTINQSIKLQSLGLGTLH